MDVRITVELPGGGWAASASEGSQLMEVAMEYASAEGDRHPADVFSASWEAATRNQMIVATQFPARMVPTAWGELEVYAPPELISSVEEMESIRALGDIIEYFNGLWGERGVTTQPVFLIPEEHGVQAFEDAGMVFILGGDRTGIPLIAHETAHLWWGYDVSGPRWFFEGMANYGAAKFVEHYYGPGGPAEGESDPLFYRRYLMNFSLGYELPLSFDRRDALDDTAAVYHNSAAMLLSMDAGQPDGIDGVLRGLHSEAAGAPALTSDELRAYFAEASAELGEQWDSYAVRGEIPRVEADDPAYRFFEWTPARQTYVKLLRWLTPAYKKQAIGDYLGALYCAQRALDFRNEPKDRLFVADLMVKTGQYAMAWEMAAAQLENPEIDDKIRVQVNWTLAKVYRGQGHENLEMLALQYVVEHGPAVDLLYLVQQAEARLAELRGEAIDAESGATPEY